MDTVAAIGVGAALVAGLAGAVVTRIPGVPLCWTATLIWAAIYPSNLAWLVVGGATVIAVGNYLLQHRLAGGEWSEMSIADRSWILGAGAAAVGVVVAKIPGLIFGFVGGIYLSERRRLAKLGTTRSAAARAPAATFTRLSLVEFLAAAAISAGWFAAYVG